jgi:hypothetical protein
MVHKNSKFIYWTPRILSIIIILFLALFSFDVISSDLSLGEIITGMLVHNIPTLVLIIIVIISWKYEIVGGIAFLLAGLMYIVFATTRAEIWYIAIAWSIQIAGPALLTGVLFMVNWFQKKQYKIKN